MSLTQHTVTQLLTILSQWSAVIPACEQIYCPDIMELIPDTRIKVEPGNYEAGASYKFSCPVNYELIGPR